MAKEIEGKLKLQVPAGQANPAPPVGPALGQRGLNIIFKASLIRNVTGGSFISNVKLLSV